MNGNQVYYTDQQLVANDRHDDFNISNFAEAENKFMHFVRECQIRNIYIYREQLKANVQRGKYFLKVDMEHLVAFDDPLVAQFRTNPNDYLKVFERAVQIIYQNDLYDENSDADPLAQF